MAVLLAGSYGIRAAHILCVILACFALVLAPFSEQGEY